MFIAHGRFKVHYNSFSEENDCSQGAVVFTIVWTIYSRAKESQEKQLAAVLEPELPSQLDLIPGLASLITRSAWISSSLILSSHGSLDS